MSILDVLTGQETPTQGVADWLSLPSVKLGIAATLFMAGAVIIITHRHSHDVRLLAGHLARSVPLGAVAML